MLLLFLLPDNFLRGLLESPRCLARTSRVRQKVLSHWRNNTPIFRRSGTCQLDMSFCVPLKALLNRIENHELTTSLSAFCVTFCKLTYYLTKNKMCGWGSKVSWALLDSSSNWKGNKGYDYGIGYTLSQQNRGKLFPALGVQSSELSFIHKIEDPDELKRLAKRLPTIMLMESQRLLTKQVTFLAVLLLLVLGVWVHFQGRKVTQQGPLLRMVNKPTLQNRASWLLRRTDGGSSHIFSLWSNP